MTALIRYEAARNALAVAASYDEVRDIMDTAERAAVYARQAQDSDLIKAATEIRVRAQRRAGEMLAVTDKSEGGRPAKTSTRQEPVSAPTLADMGITKKQSATWQALASMTPEHFDATVEAAKDAAGEVTTAFMVREAKRADKPRTNAKKSRPAKKQTAATKARARELQESQDRGVSQLCVYARLTIQAIKTLDHFTEEEQQVLDDLRTALDRILSTH